MPAKPSLLTVIESNPSRVHCNGEVLCSVVESNPSSAQSNDEVLCSIITFISSIQPSAIMDKKEKKRKVELSSFRTLKQLQVPQLLSFFMC